MQSDFFKNNTGASPQRALFRATGVDDAGFKKPFIGIVNSYTDLIPGHVHLQEFGRIAKSAVKAAGGQPFEFNTIGICDGIAMGHIGMKYSLPSRELIADSVESMAVAHKLDGLLCIPNCDKIIPGMMMAMARLNIPTVFVSGGAMRAGKLKSGKSVDLISVFEAVGAYNNGDLSAEQLQEIECAACPGAGSCSGLFTANSMNCISEVMGFAHIGNGTILAETPERQALVARAATTLLQLVQNNTRPKDIISKKSFVNAFVMDMAMGGSTNTVLHLLAFAREMGIDFTLQDIAAVAEQVPYICKISPASSVHMEDVLRAGGVQAVMNEISKRGVVNLDAKTITGKTYGEEIAPAQILDPEVIRPLDKAFSVKGGLKVLYGTLAPEGAVIKCGAVDPKMWMHRGPAVVFNSEEEAQAGITGGKVKAGDVVVIRYEGPQGGPGMKEMLTPTSLISGMGLGDKVALITDGRFSGGTRGACIGHISPEASARGPIAAIRDGDMIKIDLENNSLDIELSPTDLDARLKALPLFAQKIESQYLRRYAYFVTSANTGAVMKKI